MARVCLWTGNTAWWKSRRFFRTMLTGFLQGPVNTVRSYQWMSTSLNDCLMAWCNAVLKVISVIMRRSVHLFILSWSSFNPVVLRTTFFPSYGLLSHINIVETMDSDERRMNPVASFLGKTIEWNEGSNQRPPVLKPSTLTAVLQGLGHLPHWGGVNCQNSSIICANGNPSSCQIQNSDNYPYFN